MKTTLAEQLAERKKQRHAEKMAKKLAESRKKGRERYHKNKPPPKIKRIKATPKNFPWCRQCWYVFFLTPFEFDGRHYRPGMFLLDRHLRRPKEFPALFDVRTGKPDHPTNVYRWLLRHGIPHKDVRLILGWSVPLLSILRFHLDTAPITVPTDPTDPTDPTGDPNP